jgi:hypothetical protein
MQLKTLIYLLALIGAVVACGPRREVAEDDHTRLPPPPPFDASSLPTPNADLLTIAKSIPPNASREQIDAGVERFVRALLEARSGELPQAAAALAALRNQPHLIASLIGHYDKLSRSDHAQRVTTLGMIGELQRTDATAFLHKTIWTPLPEAQPLEEGPTPRDLEEIVLVKAVHGLAYLRTAEADKALIEVMQRHESIAVKIAAIDSYMWNHNDADAAAQQLYELVHTDLHKFVQRPRFHRGMDAKRFNEQLVAWRKKWES